MTSLPAPKVQRNPMPTLGNNNIRTNNKEQVKHIVYSDRGSSSKLTTGTNSVKPNVSIKPFVPTAKLTLEGKVVDIDVLTKLQQQNGGNIVSFTASKEFLSNLASAKVNSTKNNPTTSSKTRVNKQEVSVFKSIAGKKTQQDKVILPKAQMKGFGQCIIKPRIEVKRFAPEIKGLFTGLSTAFKTTTSTSQNSSQNVKSGTQFQTSNTACSFQGSNSLVTFPSSKSQSPFQGMHVSTTYQISNNQGIFHGSNVQLPMQVKHNQTNLENGMDAQNLYPRTNCQSVFQLSDTTTSFQTSKTFRGVNVSSTYPDSETACKGMTEQSKKNLLLTVKSTDIFNPCISAAIGSKSNILSNLTNSLQPQTQPPSKKQTWSSLPHTPSQNSSVIVPNSARNVARTQSVITSIGSNANKFFPFNEIHNQFEFSRISQSTITAKKDSLYHPSGFLNTNNSERCHKNKDGNELSFLQETSNKESEGTSYTLQIQANDARKDLNRVPTITKEAITNIMDIENDNKKNKSSSTAK